MISTVLGISMILAVLAIFTVFAVQEAGWKNTIVSWIVSSLTILWISLAVVLIVSCGGNSSVQIDSSKVLEERAMTKQEQSWWSEVAQCLQDKGITNELVFDVPKPTIIIMQDTWLEWAQEYGFKCRGEWVRECADHNTIAIGENQYRQRLFDHGACHVFELNLTGSDSDNHTTSWWVDRGACVCEVHLR